MAILVTGGAGKTGIRLVPFLRNANIPFLMTSRKGTIASDPSLPVIKFNWLDESDYNKPFEYQFPNNEKITAIFLVEPEGTPEPAKFMIEFIDLAVKKGVNRFVMVHGSSVTKGGPRAGLVWKHLEDIGVEHSILLATWFNENFSEWQHRASIKDEGKIYTAAADGQARFVSSSDISELAFHCLTDEKLLPNPIRLLGPELLTHDEVAQKFSEVLGREIVHVRLSPEDRTAYYQKLGMNKEYAAFMTWLEVKTSKGGEILSDDSFEKIVGRKPQALSEWIAETKNAW